MPAALQRGVSAPVMPALSVAVPGASLMEPAGGMTEPEQVFWRQWAGVALAERTLTETTSAGFRELCQHFALKEEVLVGMRAAGVTSPEADRLHKVWVKLAQRVDAGMARFRLTAFGKPMEPEKKPATANPWVSVGVR
jgi:hypothetical protein